MTIARRLKAKPALQVSLYLSVILGLIILAFIAIRWSFADVYATQVSHHLDNLNRDSPNKTAVQWRLARQHLYHTLELRPAYARYFELAEKFYQKLDGLESRRNPLIQELAWNDNEPKALDYARHGLRLTPSWPYLWNRLVISKFLLKQFDSELIGGMERGMHLGPWIQSNQYSVVMLGLNYWPYLQESARLSVLQAIDQTWIMDQKVHSQSFDIKQIFSHVNFAQVCERFIKDKINRQLYIHCRRT